MLRATCHRPLDWGIVRCVFRLRVKTSHRFDDIIAILGDMITTGGKPDNTWLYETLKSVFPTKTLGEHMWYTGYEYRQISWNARYIHVRVRSFEGVLDCFDVNT